MGGNVEIYRQYFVSSLPVTIPANESQMKEISKNIDYKCNTWNKTQNFTILADISAKKGNFVAKEGYLVWYSAQVVLFLTCNHVQCINATNLFNYHSPSIFSCSLVLSLFIII